jgi:nitric oxide reductase NorD protein
MSLDEFLFGRLAVYLKDRKKKQVDNEGSIVYLNDIKTRLTIISNAVTGKAINIYPAHREGGYKNDNFFLPIQFSAYKDPKKNLSFYLFRILYLAVQKNLNINWSDDNKHNLHEAQNKAEQSSDKILPILFEEFPFTESIYSELKTHF